MEASGEMALSLLGSVMCIPCLLRKQGGCPSAVRAALHLLLLFSAELIKLASSQRVPS